MRPLPCRGWGLPGAQLGVLTAAQNLCAASRRVAQVRGGEPGLPKCSGVGGPLPCAAHVQSCCTCSHRVTWGGAAQTDVE